MVELYKAFEKFSSLGKSEHLIGLHEWFISDIFVDGPKYNALLR